MRSRNIRILTIAGTLLIAAISVFQTFFLIRTWRNREAELEHQIQVSLNDVALKLVSFYKVTIPEGSQVRKYNNQIYTLNINTPADHDVVGHYMKQVFQDNNLFIDFELGVFNCHIANLEFAGYYQKTGEKTQDSTGVLKELPSFDEFTYYMVVHFPGLQNYIQRQMLFWVFFTLVLFVLLVFFAYSIIVNFQQRKFSELQKDFINNMTHEFKTPISTINIAAEVLASEGIKEHPDRLKNYAQIIKQENTRLNGLVESVLKVARIEKKGLDMQPEEIDIKTFLDKNIGACCVSSAQKKVDFQMDNQVEAVFMADKLHLTNLIYNLIDNATKYSIDEVAILLRTSIENNTLCIAISDNGIGIPKEHLDKIFRKFYRIPTGNIHDSKGFGLGLYYVKNVCKAHRWKIAAESEPGKGTTFKIYIKLN